MQTKSIEKYFFFGLLLSTFLFTFFIFQPFWVILTLGISFSIVLHPIHKWFMEMKLPSSLSSFLTVFLFTITLCGPLLGIGALVFNQSKDVYRSFVNTENSFPVMDSINREVNKILPAGIDFDINKKVTDFVSYASDNITNIFSSAISAFFSFVLMLLIIFYFLKDGNEWRKSIVSLSPLEDKDDEKILNKLTLAINAVIKGYLFIAFIQGALMSFGLWVFGIPNPLFWGVVAAVFSLLPTIGTALVSIPAIIFLFIKGDTASAIGLSIWAVGIVGTIDNFLSPFIISKQINIPPFLILFSVLGGITLLGAVGILIGPLSMSLLYTLISIYKNEFS